jgi:hypothetical protein
LLQLAAAREAQLNDEYHMEDEMKTLQQNLSIQLKSFEGVDRSTMNPRVKAMEKEIIGKYKERYKSNFVWCHFWFVGFSSATKPVIAM